MFARAGLAGIKRRTLPAGWMKVGPDMKRIFPLFQSQSGQRKNKRKGQRSP